MTGAEIGKLTGVNGRATRRWTGGDARIPYAIWRMLLVYARLARPEQKGENPY